MHSDGDTPRSAPLFEIGQTLDLLSVSELEAQVEALRQEIARLEAAVAAKQVASAASEAIFKKQRPCLASNSA